MNSIITLRVARSREETSAFIDNIKPFVVEVMNHEIDKDSGELIWTRVDKYISNEVGLAFSKFLIVEYPTGDIFSISDKYEVQIRDATEEELKPYRKGQTAGGWSPSF